MSKILIIGETSFVASRTIENLKNIIVPSLDELDITDIDSLNKFVENNDFDVVVNFAAFTNVKEATLDPNGPAWKLNVESPGNIAKICKEKNKFLIHISTDNIFSLKRIGPYVEIEENEKNPDLFSPYGYTKLMGEKEIIKSGAKTAILRIAYPFGNTSFPEKDYLTKLVKSIKLGYPIFSDQQFTPTYIKSLPKIIEKLSNKQLSGIFHWACKGLTNPYEIGVYLNDKLNLGLEVKKGFVGTLPYAKFGGLSTEITENKLGLKNLTWKEAINDFIGNTPQELV